MATLTATKAATGASTKGLRVGLVAVTSTYSVAGVLSAGDVIQMVKVPANATPIYVALTAVQTVTGNLVCVGDGNAAARFIVSTAASAGSAVTTINAQSFAPYTYSVDDTIDITIASMSLTLSAGSYTVFAIYSMDVA